MKSYSPIYHVFSYKTTISSLMSFFCCPQDTGIYLMLTDMMVQIQFVLHCRKLPRIWRCHIHKVVSIYRRFYMKRKRKYNIKSIIFNIILCIPAVGNTVQAEHMRTVTEHSIPFWGRMSGNKGMVGQGSIKS